MLTLIVNFVKKLLNLQTSPEQPPVSPGIQTGDPSFKPPVPEVKPSVTPLPQLTDVELPRDPASSQVPEKWVSELKRFTKATSFMEISGWTRMIVITHAWHETGQFKHIIGLNNFFGITLPQKWTGKVCDIVTHEVYTYKMSDGPEDSEKIMAVEAAKKSWPSATEYIIVPSPIGAIWVRVKLVRKFADWDTVEDALTFYANKIKNMYPQSFSFRNVPEKYFYWLVNGKYQYATNPKYVQDNLDLFKLVSSSPLVKEALKA